MCGHTFLFSPPVRQVRSYIENGELGEIYFISSSRVNLGLHQRDVSVLWDLAPHDFSILNYWLGDTPDAITAVGRDSIVDGVADVAFVNMTLRVRADRERGAELALTEQAAPHGGGRQQEDGRVRRRCGRSRSACSTMASSIAIRRVSENFSSPTGRGIFFPRAWRQRSQLRSSFVLSWTPSPWVCRFRASPGGAGCRRNGARQRSARSATAGGVYRWRDRAGDLSHVDVTTELDRDE